MRDGRARLRRRDARLVDEQVIERLRRVSDDAKGAGGYSLLDVAIAVSRAALHGHEHRARTHTARVVFDTGHGLSRVAGGAKDSDCSGEFLPLHSEIDCRWSGAFWFVLDDHPEYHPKQKQILRCAYPVDSVNGAPGVLCSG